MSRIKDIGLAPSGEMKIKWVERNMPVLRGIGDKYKEQEQLDQCLSNGYLGEGTYESGKHYYQPQIPIYMESVGVQNYFAQSKSIGADNDALFAEFSK